MRWYWKPSLVFSWRVDETYVKVKGKWAYLYRALDKFGHTIDFYLSSTRNMSAAKRCLGKTFKSLKIWAHPTAINTDKASSYGAALKQLKSEGKCSPDLEHRQVTYLNNIIGSDQGKLKRLIKSTLGFKLMKSAYATLKGFEIMRMFKQGQFNAWLHEKTVLEEARLIYRNFNVFVA